MTLGSLQQEEKACAHVLSRVFVCITNTEHLGKDPRFITVSTVLRNSGVKWAVFQCMFVCKFKNMDQCSDLIVYLKTRPFSSLSYEEKCAVKERRPKPHLNIVQRDKHQSRNFHSQWYEQYQWLTASVIENKIYCNVYILFNGENKNLCKFCIASVTNFHRKARKHLISKQHILNWEQYHLLGKHQIEHAFSEADHLNALKHNEMVSRNRRFIDNAFMMIVMNL